MKKINTLLFLWLTVLSWSFGITPNEAMKSLQEGNQRFLNGTLTHPRLDKDRILDTYENGQHPFVTIMTCSDSRIPVEVVFDQGIGDVFVIRVAGNVSDTDEIGSIEYGVDHLETPVMVVLGHTSCGAVTAVATNAELHGSIPSLVDNIEPAVDRVLARYPNLSGSELVEKAVVENVWQSIEDLLTHSESTAERVDSGKVRVIGAVYHTENGQVEWLGEHPSQAEILRELQTEEVGISEVSENMESSIVTDGLKVTRRIKTQRIIFLSLIPLILIMVYLIVKKTRFINDQGKEIRILGIESKVISSFSVILMLLITACILSIFALRDAGTSLKDIEEINIYLLEEIAELEAMQMDQLVLLERGIRQGENISAEKEAFLETLEDYNQADEEFDETITRIAEHLHDLPLHSRTELEKVQNFLNTLADIDKKQQTFVSHTQNLFALLQTGTHHDLMSEVEKISEEGENLDHQIEAFLEQIHQSTNTLVSNTEKQEARTLVMIIIIAASSLIIGAVIALMIIRSLSSQLGSDPQIIGTLLERISGGDLTVDFSRGNKVGVYRDLAQMKEQLTKIIGNITAAASQVGSGSEQISQSSQQISSGANEQASSTEELSSSMEELTSNIQQNTENSMEVNKITQKVTTEAEDGGKAVNETVEAMRIIADKISIIEEISRNTNMLALNAAIEAARAGESGKGFAVVAAEVRKLAENSGRAAAEITDISSQSVASAEKAGTLITELVPQIQQAAELIQDITSASQEQSRGAEQISSAIEQLDTVIQQNASASEEMASMSEELSGQAISMSESVSFFQIDHEKNSSTQLLPEPGAVNS